MKTNKQIKFIFNKERAIILTILFFVASVRLFFEFIPSSADATWYNSDWKYRQKITINSAKVVAEIESYPVMIKTTQDALKNIWSGGKMAQVDAGDLMFTLSDGTSKIDHEIEKYAFDTGELIAWVYIPTLPADTDYELYMYYGNETCANQWDTNGWVWVDRYKVVHHFGQNCSIADCYKDSANNDGAQDATPYSGDSIANLSESLGKIGRAVNFDGDNDYIKINDSDSLDRATDITIEAFVQLNELNRYNGILDKGEYNLKASPDKKYLFGGRVDPTGESFSQTAALGSSRLITSMAEYDGYLYVTVQGLNSVQSSVYRSTDGVDFVNVHSFNAAQKIGGLNVFKGELYVFVDNAVYVTSTGSSWNTAYTGSDNLSSMVVYDNYLYAGSEISGLLYRTLTGSSWSLAEDFADTDAMDIMAMTVYDGKLFLGGDTGRIMMSSDGTTFTLDEDFGEDSVVTAMTVFDGKMWVGVSAPMLGSSYYRNYAGTYVESIFPGF